MTGAGRSGTTLAPAVRSFLRRHLPIRRRYAIRQRLVELPGFYELFARIDAGMSLARVTAQTQIAIDGFPRSANTYARSAFQLANGTDVALASHAHSARLVKIAVRHGLPTIVLIREPRAVLASVLQFTDPDIAEPVLRAYLRYYRDVSRLLDRVVLADFAETTDDFGAVVERCNARFGTAFVPYRKSPEGEQSIRQMIDASVPAVTDEKLYESVVPRPAASRADPADKLAHLGPAARALLGEAADLHTEVLARAARG